MPPKRKDIAHYLRLLRIARRKVQALGKPAFQRRLAADLKRFDEDARGIRRQVAAGQMSRQRARRSLALLTKARRETVRLRSSTKATIKQALMTIDRKIKRARKEG